MANITTNTLKIGDNNLILRDADAQTRITTLEADTNQLKEDKADIDGYYQDMAVGDAEQLISTVYTEDSVPYNFRKTAGDGDRAYVDAVVGGTVALNQLFPFENDTWTISGLMVTVTNGRFVLSGSPSITGTSTLFPSRIFNSLKLVTGHKYFIGFDGDYSFNDISFNVYSSAGNVVVPMNKKPQIFNVKYDGVTDSEFVASFNAETEYTADFTTILTDLTATFGTTIADYVYGLETATAGAGVAWLKEHFPKIFNSGYIPYNIGTLQSVAGVSEKKNTGFNQFDKTTNVYSGYLGNSGSGELWMYSADSKSVAIRCLPNTQYCVHTHDLTPPIFRVGDISGELPTGTGWSIAVNKSYGSIGGGAGIYTTSDKAKWLIIQISVSVFDEAKEKLCVNISDTTRNGTYEPYTEHTYPLDLSQTLRGIPKLKDGKLYYDGDEYLPSGQVNRRYGVVDLGTLTWEKPSTATRYMARIAGMVITTYPNRITNFTLSNGKYTKVTIDSGVNATMLCDNGWIAIYDEAYETASDFKAAMSNVYLLYPLDTPTTETAEPYQQRQIIDANGTEEFVSTSVVPVGHETRYAPNLRAKLEKSPDSPASDGVYIVQRSNGVNAYIPLASSTTIQDILSRLTALEGA